MHRSDIYILVIAWGRVKLRINHQLCFPKLLKLSRSDESNFWKDKRWLILTSTRKHAITSDADYFWTSNDIRWKLFKDVSPKTFGHLRFEFGNEKVTASFNGSHMTTSTRDQCARRRTLCNWSINVRDFYIAYYGQTDRALATRLSNSEIARHANQFGHSVDFDHAIIVDKAPDYYKRLFLEAWHSKRDQNAENEHIEIPDMARFPHSPIH